MTIVITILFLHLRNRFRLFLQCRGLTCAEKRINRVTAFPLHNSATGNWGFLTSFRSFLTFSKREVQRMRFENQSHLSVHGIRNRRAVCVVLLYTWFQCQNWSSLLLFMSLLVIITVSDIAYMLIPNKVLLPFAVVLVWGSVIHSP